MHQEEQDGIDIGGQRHHRGISNHYLDVVPTLVVDPPACDSGHFLAQFDAGNATRRPDRLTQSCEAGVRTAAHVQHMLAWLQTQTVNDPTPDRRDKPDPSVVNRRQTSILAPGLIAVWDVALRHTSSPPDCRLRGCIPVLRPMYTL
jgi:hypothetical protein